MSQKTNPTSLRLQKVSQNFTFPLFVDYFWNETFQTCRESQKYITAFLKERSFSKAFFSARMYYRKFPVFIFLQDNRVAKKERLLSLKKAVSRNIERKSNAKTKFLINENKNDIFGTNEKKNTLSLEKNKSSLLNCFNSSKDFKQVKKVFRDDFLRAKQGFFYNFSNTDWSNIQYPKQNFFWPNLLTTDRKSSINLSFKTFARPCFSFCEDVMTSIYPQRSKISIANALFSKKNSDLKLILQHMGSDTKSLSYLLSLNNKLSDANEKKFAIEKIRYSTKNQELQNILSILDQVKKNLERRSVLANNRTNNNFFKKSAMIHFQPIRFIKEDQNVMALADQIIALLEKRISFRQIKSLLFKDLQLNNTVKGIKISCSGRLGGRSKKAQKAKIQSDSYGATTAATFSSKILFVSKSAFTSYGKVGIKIWLSFEDKRCVKCS